LVERRQMASDGPQKNPLESSGNSDHIISGLALGLGYS